MYPAAFNYQRAGSVQEALSLLQQHGDGAKILAGGHSLVPLLKLRLSQPEILIDIGRINELRYIRAQNGGLAIGPLTTYAEVEKNADAQRVCAVLVETVSRIGDHQVRNRGTIGGSLAHNDPTADLPATFVALGGEVVIQGPNGQRTMKGEDFFVDLLTTALEPNEILTEVRVPGTPKGTGAAYIKHANPASGYAIVGVAAVVGVDGSGNCNRCSIAITGAGPKVTRASAAESALQGGALDADRIKAAADKASDGLETLGDLHGSPEYRAHLARVLTRRALEKATERARG